MSYQPLRTATSVRILKLNSRKQNRKGCLTGSLIETDLEEGSKCLYEAISYVWGIDTDATQVLLDDDQVIKCSRNAGNALRHMQYRTQPRMIWLDAICIDQSNEMEKSDQVTMMATIYRSAHAVLVWLPNKPQCKPFDSAKFNRRLAFYNFCYGQPLLRDKIKLPTNRSIFSKISQSYWTTRIWTVLEYSFAKRCCIFCGRGKPNR